MIKLEPLRKRLDIRSPFHQWLKCTFCKKMERVENHKTWYAATIKDHRSYPFWVVCSEECFNAFLIKHYDYLKDLAKRIA